MTKPAAGAAIIEAAEGRVSEIAASSQQFELLPTGVDRSTRKGAGLAELVARDRRGRPPGAENKTTKEIKDLCTRMFGDPMVEDFRLAMHTPESLAQYLGCTKLEAAKLLVDIRKDLRAYFYARRAPEDGDGKAAVPWLSLQVGNSVNLGGARPPWLEAQESQQNQPLSQSPPAISHGDASHGGDK